LSEERCGVILLDYTPEERIAGDVAGPSFGERTERKII
jgi:hypothetical protein